MGELSTIVYKVDFKYLIKNCLKQALWGKSWVIYDYDGLAIKLALQSINVRSRNIQLSVNDDWYYPVSVPLAADHYNETVFMASLLTRMVYAIEAAEADLIEDLDVYRRAVKYDIQLKQDLQEIAANFLNEEGVHNNAIRDAYIDAYVDENFKKTADEVKDSLKGRVTPQRYLMLYTMYGADKKYAALLKQLQEDDQESVIAKFEEQLADYDIQYENMLEDARSNLMSID